MGTVVDPGARSAGPGPILLPFEVGIPEGPGSTLQGTDLVDAADAFSVGGMDEELAVAVRALEQAVPPADAADVAARKRLEVQSAMRSDGGHFCCVYPDMPGSAGAAVAALRAGESQAIGVPGRPGERGRVAATLVEGRSTFHAAPSGSIAFGAEMRWNCVG